MSKPTDDFPAKLVYQPVAGFSEQVASKAPAPGGGSVAALSGMLGAALLTMVANLTIGKKKYVDVAESLTKLREKSEDLRARLTQQIDDDTAAFQKFRVANRLPDTDPELAAAKVKAVAEASIETITVPELTMQLCLQALELAPHGIRVNCVGPGAVQTSMGGGWRNPGALERMVASLQGSIIATLGVCMLGG